MRLIGRISNRDEHGNILFVSEIQEDDNLRVFFTADADIDADGANGQNGRPAAYKTDDNGSEYLENAGMKIVHGKVICTSSSARENVILGADNEPKVFPGGIIAVRTWYKHPGMASNDLAAYVDAETVPYVVVPPLIVQETVGVVRGCRARVTWNGRSVECVVADQGPSQKTGEISVAAARALGMDSRPRSGGVGTAEVLYELWPGQAAPGFNLQPS